MPSVDVAMARSLRPPAWELVRDALVRGVAQDLSRRDIVQDTENKITNVKTAFSSWDNCMKATFCKWPVIAVIIVGSLIIFSILWCIIRCCCCGVSCCCTCFNCLKCCGNCCGCCDPPGGGRKTKYLDEPYIPPHHGQGYHAQAPMQPCFATPAPAPAPAPTRYVPPQYAEFDVPKKAGDDALPQMPTWEQAGSKKVMLEEEVELSNLDKSPTLDQNRQRMNAPSPGPVSPMSPMSPMSTSHGGQPYGGLPGGSSGQMFNHSQQGLVPNQQAAGHGQLRQGPGQSPYGAGARNHGYNQNHDANRQSDGFGLDEPYDDPSASSRAALHGRPGQQNLLLYGAPAQQPYDSLANQPYGGALAAGGAGAHMEMRNQTVSPQNLEPFGAPPMDAAAVGATGVRNHSTSPNNHHAHGQSPYNQDQVHGQLAEMPAMPHDRSSVHTPAHLQQAQTWPTEHAAPMELPGSAPPEIHVARRPGPADNALPGHARPPYGMDPRMRNSPGPNRQTPGPRGESPYGRPPRGSPGPRNDEGYGRPPPQSPRENMNRSYSPAPPRQFTPGPERRFSPGPERRFSPGPERQRTPGPLALSKPVPPPSNSFGQSSPPRSPITNNAGFDFTSGYSRPPGDQSPPAQSPTTAAYPGQRTYKPGR